MQLYHSKQLLKLFPLVLVIFGYQSINWLWTVNLWTPNFYPREGKKRVKNPFLEIKVRGLVSIREGVVRVWFFMNIVVIVNFWRKKLLFLMTSHFFLYLIFGIGKRKEIRVCEKLMRLLQCCLLKCCCCSWVFLVLLLFDSVKRKKNCGLGFSDLMAAATVFLGSVYPLFND